MLARQRHHCARYLENGTTTAVSRCPYLSSQGPCERLPHMWAQGTQRGRSSPPGPRKGRMAFKEDFRDVQAGRPPLSRRAAIQRNSNTFQFTQSRPAPRRSAGLHLQRLLPESLGFVSSTAAGASRNEHDHVSRTDTILVRARCSCSLSLASLLLSLSKASRCLKLGSQRLELRR